MKVSIIISTRNRASQLERCFQSVARIASPAPWELVAIDNASTDDTSCVIRRFAESVNIPVRTAIEPQPGLAHARNLGITLAQGEILAFTDDDCYPAPDYVDEVIRAFSDPEIGYIGGMVKLFDPADSRITIQESTRPKLLKRFGYVPPGGIHGANMAFRRQALADIGGFDPKLGAGAQFVCEDIDACARASFAGWQGGYFPGPIVHHHHRRRRKDLPSLRRSYAKGRGAYFAKFLLNRRSAAVYARNWPLELGLAALHLGPSDPFYEVYGALAYMRQHFSARPRPERG
jgi:glycosyltransferase involved in cell wall biosynthesis